MNTFAIIRLQQELTTSTNRLNGDLSTQRKRFLDYAKGIGINEHHSVRGLILGRFGTLRHSHTRLRFQLRQDQISNVINRHISHRIFTGRVIPIGQHGAITLARPIDSRHQRRHATARQAGLRIVLILSSGTNNIFQIGLGRQPQVRFIRHHSFTNLNRHIPLILRAPNVRRGQRLLVKRFYQQRIQSNRRGPLTTLNNRRSNRTATIIVGLRLLARTVIRVAGQVAPHDHINNTQPLR